MRLSQLSNTIQYAMPDAAAEYDEAQRYDQLKGISVDQWKQLVSAGKRVTLTPAILASIGNSTATDVAVARENLSELEPEKLARVKRLINRGTVEMPIVLQSGNTLDLLSGNTRLTLLVSKGVLPTVLVVSSPTTEITP